MATASADEIDSSGGRARNGTFARALESAVASPNPIAADRMCIMALSRNRYRRLRPVEANRSWAREAGSMCRAWRLLGKNAVNIQAGRSGQLDLHVFVVDLSVIVRDPASILPTSDAKWNGVRLRTI